MTVEQNVVLVIGVYLAFGIWICRIFWRWSGGYSRGFRRNALRSAFIAAIWAPGLVVGHGGAAPAPAVIAFLVNLLQPGDKFSGAISLSAAPMIATWTVSFITLAVLDRRAVATPTESTRIVLETKPGTKNILLLLFAGIIVRGVLGIVMGFVASIFLIGLKNQWIIGVLSCAPNFLAAAVLARLSRFDWTMIGLLIWLPATAMILKILFAWAALAIVPTSVSSGLVTLPGIIFTIIIALIASFLGALVGQRGREQAHLAATKDGIHV